MSAAPSRLLCIMGSGETAPTMVAVHQQLMDRAGAPPGAAVLLDAPYGFESNADDLSKRALTFFADRVGHPLEVATMRDLDEAGAAERERALDAVRTASYVFAGPGSPSYALRQWHGTPMPGLLRDRVTNGGCVTFASAAATTLGRVTLPVYEVYKVGQPPHWLDGLDVLSVFGLNVAAMPHWDNAEGAGHDTRYCFMGARRLERLEATLPDGVGLLGVDEHTAAILDLDADTLAVRGRRTVTMRRAGVEHVFESGAVVPLDELRGPGATKAPAGSVSTSPGVPDAEATVGGGLDELLAAEAQLFERASAGEDAAAARAEFRGRLTRLADSAGGDPSELVGPFIDLALRLRTEARAARRFAEADSIRDELVRLGVEIRDSTDGTSWVMSS